MRAKMEVREELRWDLMQESLRRDKQRRAAMARMKSSLETMNVEGGTPERPATAPQ